MRTQSIATALVVALAAIAAVPFGAGPVAAQETVECSFPITVTDATGTDVTVEAAPDRIVALAPSAAQQLWAVGVEDRVVGMPMNQYTAYLEDREGRTNVVGDDGQPIQEAVVDLDPDLVLAPNIIANDSVESLRGAGLTVYRYREARSLDDVYEQMERTGLLVGEFESAANVSAEMQGTVEAIRSAVEDEDRPRVYYDLGGGWTAGANTFINELIESAGGENIAVEAGIDGYAQFSQEDIVANDPQVLVVHEGAPIPSNPAIDNSTAIREGNVVRVDANFINQPGPRNVIPLRRMAEAFHPDAMADADLDAADAPEPARCAMADGGASPTDAATPTAAGDGATDGGDDTTAGDDGPGFTVVATVIALLAAGLLARARRR